MNRSHTLLSIDVKGNKIFIKYQSFVEKPKAIDLSNLDKIKGLAEEKKELQSLYVHFRDVLIYMINWMILHIRRRYQRIDGTTVHSWSANKNHKHFAN